MKKIMVIITLFLMNSCQNDSRIIEKPFMCLSTIPDKTDRHLLFPDATILKLFKLSENKNACVRFRYREITDKALVPVVDLSLPYGTGRNSEQFSREHLILNFYDTIKKTLAYNARSSDTSF